MDDLFGLYRKQTQQVSLAVRPRALAHQQWPPDYDAVYRWRHETLLKLKKDAKLLASSKTYYSARPAEFIMDWMDTYDPRNTERKWMPFVFFMRQSDLVEFLEACAIDQESGLIEKARDMGATWVCCGYTIWRWLFIKSDAIGWGSRKEMLVDTLGDPDSIFEKLRLLVRRLPTVFHPKDFNWARHATFLKLINPENGSIVSGEAGDNIGRGGRKSIFFKDESAHYERPEKIESALGDNTRVQIDISSVNGLGNVFHRRAEHAVEWTRGRELPKGFVRKFIMDWRDNPMKSEEWYQTRRAKYEREGLLHVFAQEVDRNYSAAISNTVIEYHWIRAAIDSHIKVPYIAAAYAELKKHNEIYWWGGLDVADEGDDRNAMALREWIIWRSADEWGERDPGMSARRAIGMCQPHSGNIQCMYDSIGIGASVKSEYNRLTEDEKIIDQRLIPFIPWNAGAAVLEPFNRIIPDDDKSLLNKDFYENLKAQAWWSLRTRFYKTYKAVTEGIMYPVDQLISLDSTMPLLDSICKELAQPTHVKSHRLKTMIDKKPKGTKSPNLADSGVLAYFPVPGDSSVVQVGVYGH
jgi:hypothetical protein